MQFDDDIQETLPRMGALQAYIHGGLLDLANAAQGGPMRGLGQAFMNQNQQARYQAMEAQRARSLPQVTQAAGGLYSVAPDNASATLIGGVDPNSPTNPLTGVSQDIRSFEYLKQSGQIPETLTFQDYMAATKRTSSPAAVQTVEALARARDEAGNPMSPQEYADALWSITQRMGTVGGQEGIVRGDGTFEPLRAAPGVLNEAAQTAGTAGGIEKGLASRGQAIGAAAGEAAASLPAAVEVAENVLGAISEVLTHPGTPGLYGASGYFTGLYPRGSDRANAQTKLERLKGQQFLLAFERLKGSGTITETEGEQAAKSIANLSEAQSWESAQNALRNVVDIVERGLERKRQEAAMLPAGALGATPAPMPAPTPASALAPAPAPASVSGNGDAGIPDEQYNALRNEILQRIEEALR